MCSNIESSERTWEDNCIVVLGAEFRKVLDVSAGQSGTFHQHVSLLLSWSPGQVINHTHVVNVGCKHAYLRRKEKQNKTILLIRNTLKNIYIFKIASVYLNMK